MMGNFHFLTVRREKVFTKFLKWDGKEPVIEYEAIPELPESEPTIDEKIYEAISKSQDEIRQEGADSVMEELVKRGLIV